MTRPGGFLRQAHVLVVTGKGGVGKTTVCGVLANLAARNGLRAAVVEVGPASMRHEDGEKGAGLGGHLPGLFGVDAELGYEPVQLAQSDGGGEVQARALAPDTALVEYLNQHGMRRLSRRLVASGALEVVATAVPGMPDMLVLGKVKQMERAMAAHQEGAPDLVLLDAPAAGHAVRFLQGPRAILDAAASGPVRSQAQEVVELLTDPERCQVILVTTAEETPVSETVETAHLLSERAGTHLAAVVVNARLPVLDLPEDIGAASLSALAATGGVDLSEVELAALAAAGHLRGQRQQSQAAQVARLAGELPVPRLEMPFCFSSQLGPEQLSTLTDALAASVEALDGRAQ